MEDMILAPLVDLQQLRGYNKLAALHALKINDDIAFGAPTGSVYVQAFCQLQDGS